MITHWQAHPHADFKNKALQAQVAAKLAKLQKVVPKLDDVMHSLMMDGEAFFNAQTFEDWCADFGYDADSRAAEETFKACDNIGRKLSAGIPKEVLEKVREIVQDL